MQELTQQQQTNALWAFIIRPDLPKEIKNYEDFVAVLNSLSRTVPNTIPDMLDHLVRAEKLEFFAQICIHGNQTVFEMASPLIYVLEEMQRVMKTCYWGRQYYYLLDPRRQTANPEAIDSFFEAALSSKSKLATCYLFRRFPQSASPKYFNKIDQKNEPDVWRMCRITLGIDPTPQSRLGKRNTHAAPEMKGEHDGGSSAPAPIPAAAPVAAPPALPPMAAVSSAVSASPVVKADVVSDVARGGDARGDNAEVKMEDGGNAPVAVHTQASAAAVVFTAPSASTPKEGEFSSGVIAGLIANQALREPPEDWVLLKSVPEETEQNGRQCVIL